MSDTLIWQLFRNFQEPADTLVAGVDRLAVHHRTSAGNDGDVVLLADGHGLGRDAAGGDGNGVYGGSGSIPAGTTASAPGDGETFYLRSTSGIIDIGNTSGELIRIDNDRDELTVNSDNLELNTTTAIIGDVAGTGNSTKITVDDGGSNIKLGSTGSTWIQTAQGATSITASGVATGKVIVSGASSLPSAISHIEGADTSQVNVRAAGGVAIEATQDIQLNSASVKAANGAFNIYDSVTDGIAHAGASTMKFVTYGSNGYGLVDPIGFSAIHTPTIRSVRMGDVENEYGNMKVVVDIDDSKILIGDDVFGYESTGSIVSLGDHNYNGSGNRIYVDDPNSYVALGNTWGEKPFFFELDNDSPTATPYRIRMGDVNAAYTGVQLVIEDDDEFGNISRVAMGDVTDYLTGTKLTVDLYPEEINLHADNGVIVSGTSHSYTLPVTTPTAADSLYRVMAWKEGVSSFQVMNGANYRTATASGNILPYDDYVEVDPNVTVHLPAPIAALKGKVFHIIAGGGTGGANPGAIDVVDGSSTIEVGSSLTLDTAFESYSLVCNGSVWIILNNKP